jgi:hypothetical protein
MTAWSLRARTVVEETLKIGYLSWLFLMSGLIAWLRASGRGRKLWEPVTLIVIACLPPVWMCIETTFHPQDLFAMGLALGAAAQSLRKRWVAAGVLIALALLSQQYAVLVAIPLLVLASRSQRIRFMVSAILTAAIVGIPLVALSSGAAQGMLVGSGNYNTTGGTMLADLLNAQALVVLARAAPVFLSLALALWLVRKSDRVRSNSVAMICLISMSLGLRLVFENNFYGYYFMALAVSLVLVDVCRGFIRDSLVAWLVAVFLACSSGPLALDLLKVPWQQRAQNVIVLMALAGSIVVLVIRVGQGVRSPRLLVWVGLIATALLEWGSTNGHWSQLPIWVWQLTLSASGIALAATPLLTFLRDPEDLPICAADPVSPPTSGVSAT